TVYIRMRSQPTSNKNQNNSIFHATFLDGIRGAAALGVVYAHCRFYGQVLAFNTFDIFGYYGVITFFVLSAFLLTFRTLLDWERYHEKREETNATNSVVVNRIDHLESSVDLETNLSNVPLLSSTDSDSNYYLCIPIVVVGYVEFARFGAFLTNYYFKKPIIGAWICRVLANVFIVAKRTELLMARSLDTDFFRSSFTETLCIFLVGSICAIWYREIIRLGLLPLSLEEENSLADKSNDYNISTLTRLGFVKFIISKLPSRHQCARKFFDFGCYFLLLLKFCTLPHVAEKVFGVPRTDDMVLERKLGGLLDGMLIFFGLLSRNGSFVTALSCNLLRFCGKVSFSIYLLHPAALTIVSEYGTSIGYKAADQESDEVEKANVMLDAVMLSFVTTIFLAWLYFKCVERPFMNLTNYIAKRWLSEAKLAIKKN
ncbi:6568_t:CDS:2, partial [Dentiscutata erythropus]